MTKTYKNFCHKPTKNIDIYTKQKIYIIEKEKMADKMNKLIVKYDKRIENLIYV